MHPYQDQVNKMWDLIKLRIRALKQGFWLEAINLTYVLLEIELRLLLTSKVGERSTPLSRSEIDQRKFLMALVSLAKEKKFIDDSLWNRIDEFNKKRRDAIHGLAQGKISYPELKNVLEKTGELIYDIQNRWLPIRYGPEETYEEYKKNQNLGRG